MRLPVELIGAGILLASCAALPPPRATVAQPAPVHRALASDDTIRVGATYSAGGGTYTPRDVPDYDETGMASWYGEELRGSRTANGEAFDPDGISAAHRTLPLPSYVEVTLLDTGRTILVRVNDRGPFHSNRIIDLSLGAARQLGLTGHGARLVRVRRVVPTEADKLALRRGQPVAIRRAPDDDQLARLRGDSNWQAPQRQATSARVPSGPGPFYLQIASFSSEQRARTMAEKLNAEVSSIAGTWRVRLGPYESASKALAALAPLAARGYPDAVITR
jgi:rare lipoprotein A